MRRHGSFLFLTVAVLVLSAVAAQQASGGLAADTLPSGIIAERDPATGEVVLRWNDSSQAATYRVYRSTMDGSPIGRHSSLRSTPQLIEGQNSGDATFSRDSVAYKSDGTQVALGTPRYGDMVRVEKTTTMTFQGKMAGSMVENPHVYKYKSGSATFDALPTFTSEAIQLGYSDIQAQEGTNSRVAASVNGQYGQVVFGFAVLEDLKRKGTIPQVWTVDDLKRYITSMTVTWVGYGVGANGGVSTNGATLRMWNDTPTWETYPAWTHTAAIPAEITITQSSTALNRVIDASGNLHILAHSTYPSDGSIASSIYTDYVKLDVTVSYWKQPGNGIMVEEACTNLLTANQSSVETDLTGLAIYASAGGATFTRDISASWSGAASAKAANGASVQSLFDISTDGNGTTVTAGQTYAFSVHGKASNYGSATWKVMVYWFDADGAQISSNESAATTPTANWSLLSVVAVAPSNAVKATILLRMVNAPANSAIWWDGAQLEQNAYATSWTPGGTMRAAEILTVPIVGLSPTQMSYRQWTWFTHQNQQQQIILPFLMKQDSGVGSVTIWHRIETSEWVFETKDSSGAVTQHSFSHSLTFDGPHLLEVRLSTAVASFLVDGAVVASIVNPKLPPDLAKVYIGSDAIGGESMNTTHGQVQLLNIVPTDADSLAAYQRGANGLVWDQYTTALYSWSNTLSSDYATLNRTWEFRDPLVHRGAANVVMVYWITAVNAAGEESLPSDPIYFGP